MKKLILILTLSLSFVSLSQSYVEFTQPNQSLDFIDKTIEAGGSIYTLTGGPYGGSYYFYQRDVGSATPTPPAGWNLRKVTFDAEVTLKFNVANTTYVLADSWVFIKIN